MWERLTDRSHPFEEFCRVSQPEHPRFLVRCTLCGESVGIGNDDYCENPECLEVNQLELLRLRLTGELR